MEKKKKILIVDDDLGFSELLRIRLGELGFSVDTAEDGIGGIYKLGVDQPDLVILDLVMPHMDGYTFIEELKRIKGIKPVPVIVSTVKEVAEEAIDGKIVVDFIVKPYSEASLLAKIRKALKIEDNRL
ncbi:MAG: response regulator transcription factor [Candidatus Omnitrophica bacterium]|nr:response regulator transcription factor [Candidatus Omnitrophota bacterium]